MMACRVGDLVVEATGGPNPIVFGCATVLIGPKALPKKPEPTRLKTGFKEELDVGSVKGGVDIGATINRNEAVVRGKVDAMASVLQGSLSGNLNIPIPFTKKDLTVGLQVTGALLSAGAGAEASGGWTKEEGYHAKLGAKAGAGLFGAGAGVSFGLK
jgi:hypothetical protein